MRRETKFTFSHHQLSEVKNALHESNFLFAKAFPTRKIYSLYFDTPDVSDYCDNVAGISERCKMRLRWYHNPFRTSCDDDDEFQLELKLKKNRFGEKLVHKMSIPSNIVIVSGNLLVSYIQNLIPAEYRPLIDPCSELTLGVCYTRQYFVSHLMDLRCTIDTNIEYWDPQNSRTLKPQPTVPRYRTEYNILELKFPAELEESLPSNFESVFPIISGGRHSKYATGCNLIYS